MPIIDQEHEQGAGSTVGRLGTGSEERRERRDRFSQRRGQRSNHLVRSFPSASPQGILNLSAIAWIFGAVDVSIHSFEMIWRPFNRPSARTSCPIFATSRGRSRSGGPMTPYLDVVVIPVPRAKLDVYKQMSAEWGKAHLRHGAMYFSDAVGDDVQSGELTSFPQAVQLPKGSNNASRASSSRGRPVALRTTAETRVSATVL